MIGVVDSVRNGGANISQSLVISAVAVNVPTRGTIIDVVAQGAKERDQNEMVMVVMVVSATVMVELKDVAVVTVVLKDVAVVTVELEDVAVVTVVLEDVAVVTVVLEDVAVVMVVLEDVAVVMVEASLIGLGCETNVCVEPMYVWNLCMS
jgi:hypothetical protein